jgi:hypothetical protein
MTEVFIMKTYFILSAYDYTKCAPKRKLVRCNVMRSSIIISFPIHFSPHIRVLSSSRHHILHYLTFCDPLRRYTPAHMSRVWKVLCRLFVINWNKYGGWSNFT